jgi:hypothetical protein
MSQMSFGMVVAAPLPSTRKSRKRGINFFVIMFDNICGAEEIS